MLYHLPLSWQEHRTLFQRQQELCDPSGPSGSGLCFQLSWSLLPPGWSTARFVGHFPLNCPDLPVQLLMQLWKLFCLHPSRAIKAPTPPKKPNQVPIALINDVPGLTEKIYFLQGRLEKTLLFHIHLSALPLVH